MPNHVYAVFVLNPAWSLEKIILSWKGFTPRRINPLLGSRGNFWQRDYFDRLVREAKHLANCVRYIRRNPKKSVSAKASLFCTKASSPKALSETALWKDAAPFYALQEQLFQFRNPLFEQTQRAFDRRRCGHVHACRF